MDASCLHYICIILAIGSHLWVGEASEAHAAISHIQGLAADQVVHHLHATAQPGRCLVPDRKSTALGQVPHDWLLLGSVLHVLRSALLGIGHPSTMADNVHAIKV